MNFRHDKRIRLHPSEIDLHVSKFSLTGIVRSFRTREYRRPESRHILFLVSERKSFTEDTLVSGVGCERSRQKPSC